MRQLIVNVTMLNSGCVSATVELVEWTPTDQRAKDTLHVVLTHSSLLWPGSGHLGVRISVHQSDDTSSFEGTLSGTITARVRCPAAPSRPQGAEFTASLPVKVPIVPPPARESRLLWDTLRGISYPTAFVPRDDLSLKDPLDWNLDHPHTNYRGLWKALRAAGFFVELLIGDLTCFDATL